MVLDLHPAHGRLLAYVIGITVAPIAPWASIGFYVAVAVAWFIPDRRVERVLTPARSRDSY
jgi:hypothetical protein